MMGNVVHHSYVKVLTLHPRLQPEHTHSLGVLSLGLLSSTTKRNVETQLPTLLTECFSKVLTLLHALLQ